VHLVRDALPEARGRASLRIVCIGNRWRCDDAAGLEVAARLRGTLPQPATLVEHEGEPTALIDAWAGADALWLVDAVASGAAAGTVHRLDASERELPAELFRASTHHVGVAEAVELARALGRLPRRTTLFGIEGGSFEVGNELTTAVQIAVDRVADAVRKEVGECTKRP
jgi:hydrogenase maturation protease